MSAKTDEKLKSASVGSQLQRIRDRAATIHAEAKQILIDATHWNECVRKENEEPIDADPDGSVERTVAYTSDVIRQCDEKLAALNEKLSDCP